jgi:Xaa-Pro aminopeptidase
LLARDLHGFVVPISDEHMSEYVGAYAQRLEWLTGFGGSAGTAVVLQNEAAIFVDGRYTIQVRDQVDGRFWSYESVPQTSVARWLGENAPDGARIGYDAWLHGKRWVEAADKALRERGGALVAVDTNPIDTVWTDRPAPSLAPALVHGNALAPWWPNGWRRRSWMRRSSPRSILWHGCSTCAAAMSSGRRWRCLSCWPMQTARRSCSSPGKR